MAIWQTRSRRIATTQSAINNRIGRGAGAAPVAPATQAGAPAQASQWFSMRIANIALVAAVVIVSVWGLYFPAKWSDPSPAAIGSWGRGHWFSLLLLWGIGAALIWLNASERVAKTLQTVLAGVVSAMLIVFPLLGWTPSVVTAQKQAQPAEASTLTIPAGVGEKSGRIRVSLRKRVVMTGKDFRYNCVYGDGHEESFIPGEEPPCHDGDLPFVYATNLKNEENVVAYAYAEPLK